MHTLRTSLICFALLSCVANALIYQQCRLEKVCVGENHVTQICINEGSGVEIKVWSSTQQYYTTNIPFAGINPRIAEACPAFRNASNSTNLLIYDFGYYQLKELDYSNDEKELLKLTFDSLVIQDRLTRNLEDIRNKRKIQMTSFSF